MKYYKVKKPIPHFFSLFKLDCENKTVYYYSEETKCWRHHYVPMVDEMAKHLEAKCNPITMEELFLELL